MCTKGKRAKNRRTMGYLTSRYCRDPKVFENVVIFLACFLISFLTVVLARYMRW